MKDSYLYKPPQEKSRIVILCDHATNKVPEWINGGSLGISAEDMERHIAYDVGALRVSEYLADFFDAHLLATQFSRLVIDPNRGEDDPTLIMKFYDRTIVEANRKITESGRHERIAKLHRPYHKAISSTLSKIRETGETPIIISIHSFTNQLNGRTPRPWHIGILSAEDRHLAEIILQEFRQQKNIIVGDNEPYSGALKGDTLDQHGIHNQIPHALIEIRNDLIHSEEGQAKWAKICGDVISSSLKKGGYIG